MSQFFPASCENKHYKSRLKCHCPGKCSRGQKLYGQLIWLKLSTEVGCNEISQKSVWLSSLTFNCVVSAGDGRGGVSFFFSYDHQKYSLQGEILKVPFNSRGKLCCQMNLTMDSIMELSVHACKKNNNYNRNK